MTQSILKATQVEGLVSGLNAKQPTLVSGTNIKTVNGNSLLGSGNIEISNGGGGDISLPINIGDVNGLQSTLDAKQNGLVSGSTIKTINGNSLLGSGNIEISSSESGNTTYLTDFGAIGDGNSANATINDSAIALAIAYISSTGNKVVVPPGVYVCNPFAINIATYASQGTFVGTDRSRCVFKRNGTGSGAFITVGSVSSTSYQVALGFSNIKIDGGAVTNGPAFQAYDLVRSHFENCQFTGGSIACSLLGGISVGFTYCLFESANIGVKIDKFSSLAGGGWPNIITFNGGEIVDNQVVGMWFDGGRMVSLSHIDVEGNGTTLGASGQGGIWVGPSVGQEVSVNDTQSIGLIVESCWFEANRGFADIHVNSGITSINRSNFFSNAGMSTHDIRIEGTQYTIKEINCSFSKTSNVFEGSGTAVGNLIAASQIPNIAFTSNKTTVLAGNRIYGSSGEMVSSPSFSKPVVQAGGGATAGGTGVATITFPVPYSTTPAVSVTAVDSGGVRVVGVRITNLTPTSFTVETTTISSLGGPPTLTAIGFTWQSIGQGT